MTASLHERLAAFVSEQVLPNEKLYREQVRSGPTRWQQPPIMDELQRRARAQGLWNLFLPADSAGSPLARELGGGLTNRAYAPLCETMGRSLIAPEVFNCSAPDTGNMEVFARYGTPEQQELWLRPLLEGTIRSGFAMTEPGAASSDATNIAAEIRREGDEYVLEGRKWWTTGAAHPRCRVLIFLGRSDSHAERHRQHTMLVVPIDTPGVRVVRTLSVFGYDEAPHGHVEIAFEGARVPRSSVLLGEGRGFEIGQGRLGPGRLHHCLRSIGRAERALELLVRRVRERVAFGKPLAEQGVIRQWIADSRIEIDGARLLVYDAAERLDREGNKAARHAIAAAKVVAPNVAARVIDRAIQAFGAAGVSDDTFLAEAYAYERSLRLADGPDEVHRDAIARAELAKAAP